MLDFFIDQQFLQTHTLNFKLPANDLKTSLLAEDITLEFEGQFYFISELGQTRVNNEIYTSVKANASYYRLGERKESGQFTFSAVTPALGLSLILEAAGLAGLDWTIGLVSASTELYSMDVTDASYLDMLFQWAKICSCEMTFSTGTREVNMRETIGNNYGLSFRYDRNLTEISRVVIPPAVTRLYPYGRLDLTIAPLNGGDEFIEDYSYYTAQGLTLPEAQAGYRKDETYKDESFIDVASLYNAGVARLALLSQPVISYVAKVVDLSTITGYEEAAFGMGDYVVVDDDPLGISAITRVVRFVRYPYEPDRNQIELSNTPPSLPDGNVSSTRADNKTWELYQRRNTGTVKLITEGRTVLHRLPLIASDQAEWIVSYSISGVGIVSGQITLTLTDDTSGDHLMPGYVIDVVAGERFELSFSFASQTVATGTYMIVMRAQASAGCSGSVEADGTALWVLARGITEGINPAYVNSVRFDYTGSVQSWTVPDDVTDVRIEAHGARGGEQAGYSIPGSGGMVTADFSLIAGTPYDVFVGGYSTSFIRGWPNGGNGGTANNEGRPGGGSSSVQPDGGTNVEDTFLSALVVAAGGGGGSDGFYYFGPGGHGGFYAGGDGYRAVGSGATQSAPGIGAHEDGDTDAIGYGGDGEASGAVPYAEGGGGGGGWHGGGGALNQFNVAAGGGGSGWVSLDGYDIDYMDGENYGHGYVIISWPDPTV